MITRNVVILDCQVAGISGDMLLGALLDLGANQNKVISAVNTVKDHLEGCKDLRINIRDVIRRDVRAKLVEITVEETFKYRTGKQLKDALVKCLESIDISTNAKTFAISSLETLLMAEMIIHNKSINNIHLHELGSADTLIDIIGVATAADSLKLFNNSVIYSTPVAVGGGIFESSHGYLASPALVTLEILKSKHFIIRGGPINAELTTPTGAALLVNLATQSIRFFPEVIPSKIGYGAGKYDFKEFPNVLRVCIGKSSEQYCLFEEVYILETNLDDVSGELMGYVIEGLLKEGAKDVSIIPMTTKKSRPGVIVKVIVTEDNLEQIMEKLMKETGTLGIRIIPAKRCILQREIISTEISIQGRKESIRVKIARNTKGDIIRIKPEYEDVKRIADELKMPLREVMEIVITEVRRRMQDEKG